MKIKKASRSPLFSSVLPSLLHALPAGKKAEYYIPHQEQLESASRQSRKGFTIIEMLVVVSIATLLMSVAANVATQVVEGNQLTQAGEMITDELRLARQTALARDRVVEVRFYKPSNANSFGEQPGVNAVQSFIFDDENSAATPLKEIRTLPGAVKVSDDATLSTLIVPARLKSDWKEGDTQLALPDTGTDYSVYRIRFLPDGNTDLDAQQNWFLTLHNRREKQTPPPNYVTIQVKAARGSVRTFRP